MLEDIWDQFFLCISTNNEVKQVSSKVICGVFFLYIQVSNPLKSEEFIKNMIISCSKQFTTQYKLIYRIEFVRCDDDVYVFRHRFFVPNKKMFCCGNECVDCTRFRK